MYGFTCDFFWEGRQGDCQIVYTDTWEYDPYSLGRVLDQWETNDPIELAKYEIKHRDWSKPSESVRICVWSVIVYYLDTDPGDHTFKPPTPTERELLELIANGEAQNFVHGWDT